jgi:hypothetical protein
MSKGTPTRTVRITDKLWWEIKLTVEYRNAHSKRRAWTLREFLVLAAREKIAKMQRSRGRKLTEDDEMIDLSQLEHGYGGELFPDKDLEDLGANT